jgi:hypothetical protein
MSKENMTLLTAIYVAEEVCFPGAHRQVVLTIPKRLHTRFDRRRLLGKLSACAWTCLQSVTPRWLPLQEFIVPGFVIPPHRNSVRTKTPSLR